MLGGNMEPLDIALRAWALIFSALLLLFAGMAYRRCQTTRLALILSVFSLFTIKGLILVLAIIPDFRDLNLLVTEVSFHLTFDSITLLLLFLTLTRGQNSTVENNTQEL